MGLINMKLNTKDAVYHTATQADYDDLMIELEKLGCEWLNGRKPTKYNKFHVHKEKTCVHIEDKELFYSTAYYFESTGRNIIDYKATKKEYEFNVNLIEEAIKGFIETRKKLVDAIIYGYKVEKENLYWVRDNEDRSLLIKETKNKVGRSSGCCKAFQESHKEEFTFTESEIKTFDERYWAFAVPVEEE